MKFSIFTNIMSNKTTIMHNHMNIFLIYRKSTLIQNSDWEVNHPQAIAPSEIVNLTTSMRIFASLDFHFSQRASYPLSDISLVSRRLVAVSANGYACLVDNLLKGVRREGEVPLYMVDHQEKKLPWGVGFARLLDWFYLPARTFYLLTLSPAAVAPS